MLNHFTHESQIPECCRRCFYIRKASKNSKFKRCSLKIIIPVKKKSCAKQKDNVIYVFWKFLKDRGLLKEYLRIYRLEESKEWRIREYSQKHVLKHNDPLMMFGAAFPWFGNDPLKWSRVYQEWANIVWNNFKYCENGEWRLK